MATFYELSGESLKELLKKCSETRIYGCIWNDEVRYYRIHIYSPKKDQILKYEFHDSFTDAEYQPLKERLHALEDSGKLTYLPLSLVKGVYCTEDECKTGNAVSLKSFTKVAPVLNIALTVMENV